MKFFNTAGPVNPDDHYCLSPSIRLKADELRVLLEQKKYFILHAPRQTGKTSTMLHFVKQLNEEGKYIALYVNVEPAQALRGRINESLPVILQEIKNQARNSLPPEDPIFAALEGVKTEQVPAGSLLTAFLGAWSRHASKPVILFIDEIDSLMGDTLLSVLRQLRSGYSNRPQAFPQSICLIGVRDVRDYQIWSEGEQQMIMGGSAFNIKAKSIRMSDFSFEQLCELYRQHTDATGQLFESDALEYVFKISCGQPWLVNALAYETCFELQKDRKQPITKELFECAKENIIKRRETHIDVLVDRLREPRVRAIIDAIITGIEISEDFPIDDIQYLLVSSF